MPPSDSVARPSRSHLCPLAPACGQDAGLYPPRLWWLQWWKLLPVGEQGLRAGPARPLQSVCGCLWLPLLVTGLQWWWPQEPSAPHGCAWCRSCRAAQAWGLAWPDGLVLPSPPATQRPPTPTVSALNLGGPKPSCAGADGGGFLLAVRGTKPQPSWASVESNDQELYLGPAHPALSSDPRALRHAPQIQPTRAGTTWPQICTLCVWHTDTHAHVPRHVGGLPETEWPFPCWRPVSQ